MKKKPLKNAKRHPVRLAEIAYGELCLPGSLSTHADEARLGRVWRGLQWLDDDQAALRRNFMVLLEAYDKDHKVEPLIKGLRKLSAIPPGQVKG